MVHTSYLHCQKLLKDHLALGKSLQDYRFLTRRPKSVENLKSRNVVPPINISLEKYCELLNLAYRQGQNFLFDDIRDEQIQTDAQLAYLLASDEIEMLDDQTKADEDLAKKLDKSWNSGIVDGTVAHGGGRGRSQSKEKKKSSTNDTAQDKMKAHSNQSLKPAEGTFEKKLAEVKRDVLKEAHQLLESIFTKTFDSKCTNAAKVLRTHEVYVAVNALQDFGVILASYNLCIALVNSETDKFYAGFDAKNKVSQDKQDAGGSNDQATVVLKREMSGNRLVSTDINNQTANQTAGTSPYEHSVGRQQYQNYGSPEFPSIPPVTRVMTLPQQSLPSSSSNNRQDSFDQLHIPSHMGSGTNVEAQGVRGGATYYQTWRLRAQYPDPLSGGAVCYGGRGGGGAYSEFPGSAAGTYQTQIIQQSGSGDQAYYPGKSSFLGESGITEKQGGQIQPSSGKCSVGGSHEEAVDPYQAEYHPQEFSLAVKSPGGKRTSIKQSGGHQKKLMTGHEIAPLESMQAMAESKSLQITLAMEALCVRRINDNFQNLYPNIESLNRKLSRGPNNLHSFYKIIAKYFHDLAAGDNSVVPNLLRERMAKFGMENFHYLQVISTKKLATLFRYRSSSMWGIDPEEIRLH